LGLGLALQGATGALCGTLAQPFCFPFPSMSRPCSATKRSICVCRCT